jgi:hypothetical protein
LTPKLKEKKPISVSGSGKKKKKNTPFFSAEEHDVLESSDI